MIRGVVIKGDGMAGKVFGVPTANLRFYREPEVDYGVYVGTAEVDGERVPAVAYYGVDEKFEVHLLDREIDLYGKELNITLAKCISPYVPWESEAQMKRKIANDMKLARKAIKEK